MMGRRLEGTAPLPSSIEPMVGQLRARVWLLLHDRRRGRLYSIAAVAIFGAVFGGAIVAGALGSNPQFGVDSGAYWVAAGKLAGGGSPYNAAMLAGPYPAQVAGAYRYLPIFAQVLIPLSWLPLWAAKLVWLGIQIAALAAGLWFAAVAGGGVGRLDRAISIGLAFTVFTPTFACLLQGNVEGPLALLVTLALVRGEAAGGVAVGLGTLLKLMPGVALPALAVRGPRGAISFLVACAVPTAVSIALAPAAWRDMVVAIPNMYAGSAAYANNLAPAGALAAQPDLAFLAWLEGPLRLLFLGAAAALGLASIWLARRPGGWPAALLGATLAGILAPAAIWYHYSVVLLPFAFFAWPAASERQRWGLLAGLGGFALAVGWPLIFTVPAFALFTVSGLAALWPTRTSDRLDLVDRARIGPIGWPVSAARAPNALGDPEADGGAAAQVGAAEMTLEGGVEVQ